MEKSDLKKINPKNGVQSSCFLLSCVRLVKYLSSQFTFFVRRGYTNFEESKKLKKFPPWFTWRSQLPFKPVKVPLSPPSGEKIAITSEKSVMFWTKFRTLKTRNSRFFTRWEVSPTYTCAPHRVLPECFFRLYNFIYSQWAMYYSRLVTHQDHSCNISATCKVFQGVPTVTFVSFLQQISSPAIECNYK